MGRFKQSTTGGAIEPPNPNPNPEVLENGNGCTQTDHATQTFFSNAIKVDPDTVKPNSPCCLTDVWKQKSVCATKTDEINLAADMFRPPQNSIFANNPELKKLVQKYLFKVEIGQGDLGWSSGDRPRGPAEDHPCVPAAGHVAEMHRSALEEPTARWSQIKETPSPLTFPPPTQAEAACGCTDGLVSETRESNTSDSKRWPYSQPSGTNRFDLNPIPYQSTVVQDPLTSITFSEPFHGIKSLLNKTPITDHSPQVESTVLQYKESITSSESFHSIESQVNGTSITGHPARVEGAVREMLQVEPEESTSGSANNLCDGIPGDAVRSSCYLAEASTNSYCIDQDDVFNDGSPVMVNWHDSSDVEEMYEEKSFRTGGREDRGYVCPVILQKLMARPFLDQYIDEEEDGGVDAAKVLHSETLTLVYSTIEESLPVATIQLLSDLLQPGFHPPKNITAHLLRGLLLAPRCPLHLRVQAFDLLMKTQRHHRADRSTIPWDWELLTTTMDNQEDPAKRHLCEVVRMLLVYVLRTMEDDFRAKLSSAALNESIARAFLSCTSQVTKVREVMRWLCAAIIRATAEGAAEERPRERDDHIRMVSAFQGMLGMALEVDCSPALSAGWLAQELFNALHIVMPQRSHRKLLLDSLQSELLKCMLVQHLLEHSCREKTALPVFPLLLLHFLKHSTPTQEPTTLMDKAGRSLERK